MTPIFAGKPVDKILLVVNIKPYHAKFVALKDGTWAGGFWDAKGGSVNYLYLLSSQAM